MSACANDSTSFTIYRDELTVPAADGQAVAVTYMGGWDPAKARPAVREIALFLLNACVDLRFDGRGQFLRVDWRGSRGGGDGRD